MKLRIEIDLNNAAFDNSPEAEIHHLLELLSFDILADPYFLSNNRSKRNHTIPLIDINGNTVGTAEVIE